MGRFRKKPVSVEAWQWTGDEHQENLGWISEAMEEQVLTFDLEGDIAQGALDTGKGRTTLYVSDWIVKEGEELTVVQHDQFTETYERLVG